MLDMLKVAAWHYLPALRKDTRGVTALEYGILAGLIAVVIIAAVTTLGSGLHTVFQNLSDKVAAIPTN
jgi:pilus assembly protein Flp/PilA